MLSLSGGRSILVSNIISKYYYVLYMDTGEPCDQ